MVLSGAPVSKPTPVRSSPPIGARHGIWQPAENLAKRTFRQISPDMSGSLQLAVSHLIYALRCSLAGSGCIVGIPDRGTGIGCSRGGFLRVARNSLRVGRTLLQRWWGEAVLAKVRLHVPPDYFRIADHAGPIAGFQGSATDLRRSSGPQFDPFDTARNSHRLARSGSATTTILPSAVQRGDGMSAS